MLLAGVACAVSAAAVAQDLPDRWIPSEQVDRFDNKKTIGATNPARATGYFPQRRPAEVGKTANLRVLCAKGQTVVYVELLNQLIAGSGVLVSYKFDDRAPVERQRWETSADSTATGFWGGSKAIAFAKALEQSKTLTVRTEHNVFGQMEANFETSSAKKYFDPIRAACKWKP
jgi:hypothetical protein